MSVRSASLRITDLPVRRLGPADLPACIALAADRGWPPEENKWGLMFAVSEAYGVDDPAGGLAGTVVLTRHGTGLAAVGMMMVASRPRQAADAVRARPGTRSRRLPDSYRAGTSAV